MTEAKRIEQFLLCQRNRALRAYVLGTNFNSAENWVRSMFTDPPLAGLCDEAGALKRSDTPRKETHTMTPYELFVLFSIHACTQTPIAKFTSEITRDAVTALLQSQMIERTDRLVCGFVLSERGRVYVAAVSALPLPVRQPAPWVMPEPPRKATER